jgi:hypothetical protein
MKLNISRMETSFFVAVVVILHRCYRFWALHFTRV